MQILKQHEITGHRARSVSDNQCYICKRTESQVHEFLIPHLDDMTEKYNLEIANLESKLQNKKNGLKSHLDDILRSTENSNLDFNINSVLFDMDSFKKTIPKMNELIDLRKDFSKCSTLSEIRTKILELRKEIEDDQIYERNRKRNLEKNIGKKSIWYSDCGYYRHVESFHDRNKIQIGNEEIETILESLEQLVNEREAHLKSLECKIEFIKKLKHHKISHGVISIKNIVNKEMSVENEGVLSKEEHEESYKTSITLPVCIICHSLVSHESTDPF
ncbi:Uncharacterised protein [uncultured archaeon]|nr:Uncharacterised protein [uncultured archaeon]